MRKWAISLGVVALLFGAVWILLRATAPAPNAGPPGDPFLTQDLRPAGPEMAEPPFREGLDVVAKESPDRSNAPPDALEVSVFDSEWRPLSGATVTLYAICADDRLFATDFQSETDDRGSAVLRLPSDLRIFKDDERVMLAAEHPGFAPKVESFYWPRQECSFVLARACSIFGRVFEFESHAPIAGARLIFGSEFQLMPGSPVETVTDREGWYRYDAVAPGAEEIITVLREGFKFHQHLVEVGTESENRVDLYVPRGRSLFGRVVDGETGTALPEVQIGMHTPIAATDASGRFVAHGLQETWILRIQKASYCDTAFVPLGKAISESEEVLIPLFRACSVEGVVLDAEGQPLEGASVWPEESGVLTVPEPLEDKYPQYEWNNLRIFTKRPSPELITGEDGSFRLHQLKPGSRPVRIHARHPAFDKSLYSEWLEFSTSGQSREVVLRYEGGSTIEGVIRPAGTRWRILWTGAGNRGLSRAEDDGSYRLKGVAAGQVRVDIMSAGNLGLEYVDADQIVATSTVNVVPGGISRYDFEVPLDRQGSSVAGTVVRLDGSPVLGADVEVYLPGRIGGFGVTDEHGRFRIEVAAKAGSQCSLRCGSPEDLDLEVAATIGEQELAIVLPDVVDVRLRIIDADTGLPLPRADIRWSMTPRESPTPILGAESWDPRREGSGQIVLPIGTMTLTVEADSLGYSPQAIEKFVVGGDPSSAIRTIRMQREP